MTKRSELSLGLKKKKRPWDVYAKNIVPLHKDDVEIP